MLASLISSIEVTTRQLNHSTEPAATTMSHVGNIFPLSLHKNVLIVLLWCTLFIFLLSTTGQVFLYKDEIYLFKYPIENILIIGFRYTVQRITRTNLTSVMREINVKIFSVAISFGTFTHPSRHRFLFLLFEISVFYSSRPYTNTDKYYVVWLR